jgi:hypothetical protein
MIKFCFKNVLILKIDMPSFYYQAFGRLDRGEITHPISDFSETTMPSEARGYQLSQMCEKRVTQ